MLEATLWEGLGRSQCLKLLPRLARQPQIQPRCERPAAPGRLGSGRDAGDPRSSASHLPRRFVSRVTAAGTGAGGRGTLKKQARPPLQCRDTGQQVLLPTLQGVPDWLGAKTPFQKLRTAGGLRLPRTRPSLSTTQFGEDTYKGPQLTWRGPPLGRLSASSWHYLDPLIPRPGAWSLPLP